MQQRGRVSDINMSDWAWALIQWSPERSSLTLIVKISGELHGRKPSLGLTDAEMICFCQGSNSARVLWVRTVLPKRAALMHSVVRRQKLSHPFPRGCEFMLVLQLSCCIKRQKGPYKKTEKAARRVGWDGLVVTVESVSWEQKGQGSWALGSAETPPHCLPFMFFVIFLLEQHVSAPSPRLSWLTE